MRRRNHYDVTNRVEIDRPHAVEAAVIEVLTSLYPGVDVSPVQRAFAVFGELYAGTLRGYWGCDTWYHDAQHSLDCALAFARLLHGYEIAHAEAEQLGARRGVLGVIAALFHDAGYIRRHDDKAQNGAEFTFVHVGRSGVFLADLLPQMGFAAEAQMTSQLVHFTGYEMALDAIAVPDAKDRMLGFMLGTADVLAQTSDRCYLEKCRDYLYSEFVICGLAGEPQTGGKTPVYSSPQALLQGTPEFNQKMWEERLDGYFGSVHRYMSAHFGGQDLYTANIREHLDHIRDLNARNALYELNRKPKAIRAEQMRERIELPR